MTKLPLSDNDFISAASTIGCKPEAIKSVCHVEAPNGGFFDDSHPALLFERHIFSKQTNHIYDDQYPGISNQIPGGYCGGMSEYSRLAQASSLNKDAANMSASWGKFQLMGFNYYQCGYDNLNDFLTAMYNSEQDHLNAFIAFIQNTGLDKYLISLDWVAFANGYNGPNYKINMYDVKLQDSYNSFI